VVGLVGNSDGWVVVDCLMETVVVLVLVLVIVRSTTEKCMCIRNRGKKG